MWNKASLFLILLLCFPLASLAKDGSKNPPEIKAVRAEEEIIIDGRLDETVWQREGYTDLIQRDPIEGAEPTEKTEVLIAYNDDGLFVAGTCCHSGPDSIAGGLARRDKFIESDWFWFWIDPNYDRQNGFGFAINPDGSIIDQKLYQDILVEDDWDSIWETAAQKHQDRWIFEMFIPFSQLRFDKKDEYVWGVNFKRYIIANAEDDYFVMVPRAETGFVSRFGKLTGLADISPPARLFISAYAMGKVTDSPGLVKGSPFYTDQRYGKNIGLDVKYGLTGNLTLDLAVNPDFGQAEVDPAVINLSAFEIYYSEKRAFFQEGSDIFYFGSNPAGGVWGCYWQDPTIFYSRRIGKQPMGKPTHEGEVNIPEWTTILGAAKVSGKIGNWSVGSANAITQQEFATVDSAGVRFKEEVEPMTYYGVFRGLQEFNEGDHGLGSILTVVAREQDVPTLQAINNSSALVTGIDGWTFFGKERNWALMGKLATSSVFGTKERISQLQQSSVHYYQRPDFEAVSLDTNRTSFHGFLGRFGFKNMTGSFIFETAMGMISPGFDTNDVGYTRYGNLINTHVVTGYRWLEPASWYRRIYIHAMTSRNFDFDGNRLFSQYYFNGNILFPNYLAVNSSIQFTPEGLDLFTTRGGPIMAYPGHINAYFGFDTDYRKNIQLGGSFTYQPYEDGSYGLHNQLALTFKPISSLKLTLSANYMKSLEYSQWVDNVVDPAAEYGHHYVFAKLDQEEVSATFRMDWGITPKLSLQCYIQPFISVGYYSGFKDLARARSYDFLPYDYTGPDSNFNFKSFKGNFVLRWEYFPGSLLYLVWTQDRTNYDRPGVFDPGKDLKSLFNEDATDIFFVKLSYMLSVY